MKKAIEAIIKSRKQSKGDEMRTKYKMKIPPVSKWDLSTLEKRYYTKPK
jgi:hypothetical protein